MGCQAKPAATGTAPTPCARDEADAYVRSVLTPALIALLAEEDTHLVFEPSVWDCRGTWNDSDSVITFYVRDYALDLPRDLILTLRNPWLFRAGAGWRLAGDCPLTVFIDEELGLAAQLRRHGENLDLDAEGLAAVDQFCPGYADEFRTEIRRRFCYENDYQVIRRLFATNMLAANLEHLSPVELFEYALLVSIKSVVARARGEDCLTLLETPHFHGIVYGRPDSDDTTWCDLHTKQRQIFRLTIGVSGTDPGDRQPLLAHLPRILASVRRHNSPHPGRELLTAARTELRKNNDRHAREIARCLVLCASRYDDARTEALELGRRLVDAELDYGPDYLNVLTSPPVAPAP